MKHSTGKRYSLAFKIKMVEADKNRPYNLTQMELADQYGVGYSTFKRWVLQDKQGLLRMDNAIAVSRSPNKVATGDKYHVGNMTFDTKDEAISHCVALAGGITVTRMITEKVDI